MQSKTNPKAGKLSLLLVLLSVALVLNAAGQQSTEQLPDSPGATAQTSSTAPQTQAPSATQPSSQPSNARPATRPQGTAAAETPATTGVAASTTAGAAIAPAKQRRSHALVLKIGAIVGVGVAVGTVAALSSGSPSRPPGSH
jgi:hypothetical protein